MYKAVNAIVNGEHLPRRLKKQILGKVMSSSQLKKLLKTVKIEAKANTMYQRPLITPYAFCPKCGCTGYYGTGNKTEYPEHWEYFYCIRCRNVVGYIDNSPFIHALECEDYDPVF
jgi:hypothetical protein